MTFIHYTAQRKAARRRGRKPQRGEQEGRREAPSSKKGNIVGSGRAARPVAVSRALDARRFFDLRVGGESKDCRSEQERHGQGHGPDGTWFGFTFKFLSTF